MPPAKRGGTLRGRIRPDAAKFVPAKTLEQQGVLALHSVRSLLVKQQTMLANAMRKLGGRVRADRSEGHWQAPGNSLELVDADATFPKESTTASHQGIARPLRRTG